MSTERSSQDGIREQLVAYLDGELSPEECREIEERLSSDDAYCRQMQELDDVWQTLDELPQKATDDSFTRTTIEMVTVAAENELAAETAALPARRRHRWLAVAAVGVVAVLIGFLAANLFSPDPNRALLADLPLIQHIDAYAEVGDIEFLRKLQTNAESIGLKGELAKAGPDAGELQEVSLESPRERRGRVARMSPDQQAALLAKSNRFQQQLSRDERARIRALHEAILAAPDTRKLQETLLAYGLWLEDRTPGERADLRERSPTERIERIEKLAKWDRRREFRELSREDAAALRNETLSLFDERLPFIKGFMERDPRIDDVDAEIKQRRGFLALGVAMFALHSDRNRDEVLDRFLGQLSKPVQKRMEGMPREQAAHIVRRWIRQAFREDVTSKDMERFFVEKLDNARREELLAMPQDQREEALYEQYLRENFGQPDELEDYEREWGRRPGRGDGRRRDGNGRRDDDEMQMRRRRAPPPPRGDGPPGGPPPGRRDRDRPDRPGPPPEAI